MLPQPVSALGRAPVLQVALAVALVLLFATAVSQPKCSAAPGSGSGGGSGRFTRAVQLQAGPDPVGRDLGVTAAREALAALERQYGDEQRRFCQELAAGAESPLGTPGNSSYKLVRDIVSAVDGNVTFSMWTHALSDTVSETIQRTNAWEPPELKEVLGRLQEWRDMHVLGSSGTVMMDIGANVGWYSVNAAALGYKVFAFEPMAKNIGAIRRTLCENPWMQDTMTLVSKGLNNKPGKCSFWMDPNNQGNGFTMCEGAEMTKIMGRSSAHKRVGEYELTTLDDVLGPGARALAGRVGAIKIDVEGYEPNVYAGGRQFMDVAKPNYIMAELNQGYPGTLASLPTIKLYLEMGYEVRTAGFSGPALDPKDMETTVPQRYPLGSNNNIYLTRRLGT